MLRILEKKLEKDIYSIEIILSEDLYNIYKSFYEKYMKEITKEEILSLWERASVKSPKKSEDVLLELLSLIVLIFQNEFKKQLVERLKKEVKNRTGIDLTFSDNFLKIITQIRIKPEEDIKESYYKYLLKKYA